MKNLQKKLRLLSYVMLACFLFSSMTLPVKAYIQKPGTVNEDVTLRQKADANSDQVMELTKGQAVKINNELAGSDGTTWYQIIVNNNNFGYVPASTVTISGDSLAPEGNTTQVVQTVTITERIGTVTAGTAIRVREEATTASEQIASMEPKDTFLVLEDVNASDGHVWHKVEFDDHGTMVIGYVRGDLVDVKEVTREEEQIVDVPVTDPATEPEEAPYSISSQVNAEGSTVWYLTDNATGTSEEISSLLTAEPEQKGGNGVYKIIVVILLILVILAVGAATFFYMRWRDAEEFISELREKQARAKKQPVSNRPTQTKQNPQTKSTTGAKPIPARENGSAGTVPGALPKMTLPTNNTASKPVSQPAVQQTEKPAGQPKPQQQARNVQMPRNQQPAAKPDIPKPPTSRSEVLPNTMDIVNTTKQELKNSANSSAAKQQSSSWKSKNFLTDDDDLEFDFLDMEDK